MATTHHLLKKILVIDDNPTIVEFITQTIKLYGHYQVVVAFDGVEGLEKVYQERPDCVIVDVKMPRMDGYQLVRCLRGDQDTADIPLIILSAMIRKEDKQAGLLSGVDEYLVKPLHPALLYAAIDKVLKIVPQERLQRMQALAEQCERDEEIR